MDKYRAQKAFREARADPKYVHSKEYKDAIKHAHAHYKGVLRASQDRGAMGGRPGGGGKPSRTKSCAALFLVAGGGWTVAVAMVAVRIVS